jgi:hypothetical protein
MEESKEKSNGAMLIEKEQFRVAEEFEGARDLNLRPIAYTIFGMTVLFIVFITYLISQHK